MSPNQHETELVKHYDKLASTYTELYEGPTRLSHFYNIRRTRVFELLKDVAAKKLLEVGCGVVVVVVAGR